MARQEARPPTAAVHSNCSWIQPAVVTSSAAQQTDLPLLCFNELHTACAGSLQDASRAWGFVLLLKHMAVSSHFFSGLCLGRNTFFLCFSDFQSAEPELNRLFAGKKEAGSSPHPCFSPDWLLKFVLFILRKMWRETPTWGLFLQPLSSYITKTQYQCTPWVHFCKARSGFCLCWEWRKRFFFLLTLWGK